MRSADLEVQLKAESGISRRTEAMQKQLYKVAVLTVAISFLLLLTIM